MCQLTDSNTVMSISGDVVESGMSVNEISNEDEFVYFSQRPCTSHLSSKPTRYIAKETNSTNPVNTSNVIAVNRCNGETSSIPAYLQPDPYEGLVEKIRNSMNKWESDISEVRSLMQELQQKAERLRPGTIFPTAELSAIRAALNDSPNVQQPQHLAKKSFKDTSCEICGLGFASVQSKIRHASRIHPDQLDKVSASNYGKSSLSHECSICRKAFSTAEQLSTHRRRRHESDRSFTCTMCSRSYPLPSELTKHMKRVHGVKKDNKHQLKSSGEASEGDSLMSRPSSRSTYSTYDGSEDMPDI